MKHLVFLLTDLYPNRLFSLSEAYHRDEVYNVQVGYKLWIEDICDLQFDVFADLEQHIYKLADVMTLKRIMKAE